MAINGDMGIDALIEDFREKSRFLTKYESTDSIINNEPHSSNTAKKVTKQINNIVKSLVSSESGIDKFNDLLDSDDLVVSSSAAEFLYPLYPKKCISVLKKYSESLQNKLDRFKVDCLIEGYEQKQAVFMGVLKKIYSCEDLESLNRE